MNDSTSSNSPEDFILTTPRLVLRPPAPEDADGLFEHMSDARLTTYLAWEPHASPETTRNLILALMEGQKNDKGYHWVVRLEGKIVGLVSLIDVRRRHRAWTINRAELSYWIGASSQGKGIATEASQAVVDFGFKQLRLHKLVLGHVPDNPASGAVARRLGFQIYGTEKDAFCKEGHWFDMCWYQMITRECSQSTGIPCP